MGQQNRSVDRSINWDSYMVAYIFSPYKSVRYFPQKNLNESVTLHGDVGVRLVLEWYQVWLVSWNTLLHILIESWA